VHGRCSLLCVYNMCICIQTVAEIINVCVYVYVVVSMLQSVMTPTEEKYTGVELAAPVCAVSILRAAESMEHALRCA